MTGFIVLVYVHTCSSFTWWMRGSYARDTSAPALSRASRQACLFLASTISSVWKNWLTSCRSCLTTPSQQAFSCSSCSPSSHTWQRREDSFTCKLNFNNWGTFECCKIESHLHLCPSLLREPFQKLRRRQFFSDKSCLQVVYGMAVVLPHRQAQPAD